MHWHTTQSPRRCCAVQRQSLAANARTRTLVDVSRVCCLAKQAVCCMLWLLHSQHPSKRSAAAAAAAAATAALLQLSSTLTHSSHATPMSTISHMGKVPKPRVPPCLTYLHASCYYSPVRLHWLPAHHLPVCVGALGNMHRAALRARMLPSRLCLLPVLNYCGSGVRSLWACGSCIAPPYPLVCAPSGSALALCRVAASQARRGDFAVAG